jgi:vitamin B12 transporter
MFTLRITPLRAPVRLLLPALFASAFAQAQSIEASALPAVVVTATRTSQLQTDAIPHTTVISAEDIRNSQALDLPSLLRSEASLQLTQNGGLGTSGGLFMRGAETRQTLVLLDGIPITKQDGTGTVSFEHIMLDQIDHIEIVRGNVSSIYGSGAVGGVIQIFSKAGYGSGQKLSASTELGSFGTKKMAFGLSGRNEEIRYQLSVSRVATEGFSALNPAQNTYANPDKDGYRNDTVSGLIAKNWGKNHEIGFQFFQAATRFEFDSGSSWGTSADKHDGKTTLNSYSAFSNDKLSDNWLSRLKVSEITDRNANNYRSSSPTADDYLSKTRVVEWNNEITIASGWLATAGANRQWQAFVGDDGYGGLYNLNRTADSVYTGVQGTVGKHQLQANLRHDETQGTSAANTGFLGYGYALSTNFKLLANASTGFTAPPLGYLYGFGGNAALKPEYSQSVETGIQYAKDASILRVSLFRIRTKDQFQFVDDSACPTDACGQFENVARARNEGLEVSATHKLATWQLRASLTVQDPIDLDTNERLRRRANYLGSLAAYRSVGALHYGVDLSYTGARTDGTNELSAYWLVNATTRYAIDKQWSVQARLANLLDAQYQTAYGFNQPARSIFVGLNWQH